MQNQNIVRDYTKNNLVDNQELAVMPAMLAEKLLKLYTSSLNSASVKSIIGVHIDKLRECTTIAESIAVSIDYTNERVLIENIHAGNWGVYDIEPENTMTEEEIEKQDEQAKYFHKEPKAIGNLNFTTREIIRVKE